MISFELSPLFSRFSVILAIEKVTNHNKRGEEMKLDGCRSLRMATLNCTFHRCCCYNCNNSSAVNVDIKGGNVLFTLRFNKISHFIHF